MIDGVAAAENRRALGQLRENQELNLIMENLRLSEEMREQEAALKKLQIQTKLFGKLRPAAKSDNSCQTDPAAMVAAAVVTSGSAEVSPTARATISGDQATSQVALGTDLPTLLTDHSDAATALGASGQDGCADVASPGCASDERFTLARSDSMNSVSSLGSIDEDRDCIFYIRGRA